MNELVEVVEFTDPGCVWSWGTEPIVRWLGHRYPGRLKWRRVFGVQLDTSAAAPGESPDDVRRRWLDVAEDTDAPVPERLAWAHDSTRPAALAAKAAERQGPAVGDHALRRLRQAFFVAGRPPDTSGRIAQALRRSPGLDLERLLRDLESADLLAALEADWHEARRPHPDVIGLEHPPPHPGGAKHDESSDTWRYAFPTLLVRGPAGERVIPGWRSPGTYRSAIEEVAPALAKMTAPPLDPSDALERYRALTTSDLLLLTESSAPPPDAVEIATATTPLWLLEDEADHLASLLPAAARV